MQSGTVQIVFTRSILVFDEPIYCQLCKTEILDDGVIYFVRINKKSGTLVAHRQCLEDDDFYRAFD